MLNIDNTIKKIAIDNIQDLEITTLDFINYQIKINKIKLDYLKSHKPFCFQKKKLKEYKEELSSLNMKIYEDYVLYQKKLKEFSKIDK